MFVRVKTRPNTEKKAVQIVKSIRQKDKVNQKVVCTVGYAFEDEEIEQLRDLGEYIKADIEKKEKGFFFDKEYLAKEAIKARKRREGQNKKGNRVDGRGGHRPEPHCRDLRRTERLEHINSGSGRCCYRHPQRLRG